MKDLLGFPMKGLPLALLIGVLIAVACKGRETATMSEPNVATVFDEAQMKDLMIRANRLELGMRKADVLRLLGPPTTDQQLASKVNGADGRPRVFGTSVTYEGRDQAMLPRV